MSQLDALPADQRAVLQLLLKQGKSYAELSSLLGIDASAVQTRAHAALDALGPAAEGQLPRDRREEIADYLLGQQTEPQRDATREYLAGSPDAREWGRATADALRPLGGEPLPPIPTEAPAPEREPSTAAPLLSSRLGGALLIGGIGVLIVVALILILSGGDEGKQTKSVASTPAQSTTGQPAPVAQINLTAASGGKSAGLGQVFAQGNQRLLIAAAQSLAPGNYALWLYTSAAKARLLGFVPQRVDRTGRFVTQGVLPDDARTFESLIVTREQVTRGKVPSRPGAIVLRGKLQTG